MQGITCYKNHHPHYTFFEIDTMIAVKHTEGSFEPHSIIIPDPIVRYIGYKNGVAQQFSTISEARQFSKTTERVITNQQEIAEARHAHTDRKMMLSQQTVNNTLTELAITRNVYNDIVAMLWDLNVPDNELEDVDQLVDKVRDVVDLIRAHRNDV